MRLVGAGDFPLVLTQESIRHAQRDIEGHGIPDKVLRLLPMKMNRPLAIFQSADDPNAQIVVLDMEHDGGKVAVAVHLDREMGRGTINDIRSLYRKPDGQYAYWIKADLLLYADKKSLRLGSSPVGGSIPPRRESAHEGRKKDSHARRFRSRGKCIVFKSCGCRPDGFVCRLRGLNSLPAHLTGKRLRFQSDQGLGRIPRSANDRPGRSLATAGMEFLPQPAFREITF